MPEASRAEVIVRLKRIEGQVRGVARMVETGRDPFDILDQIAAVRAAARAVDCEIAKAVVLHALGHSEEFAAADVPVERVLRALVGRGGSRRNGTANAASSLLHTVCRNQTSETRMTPIATVTDPVCGMQVETTPATAQSQYQGQTYHFCSVACKRAFDANPGHHVHQRA